ncbi:hypothetical protein ALI144C_52800 [Actinosynnema sp. ALI-1.44]|uniref:hypothetical protein n=1 Tax=Actinosynnema sp. ALI-1.44 TaxID=1933779 RepID=UPI00097CBADD|nr:hypothetical protein [Actinosynnema sp. ALI-1.44]ONI71201.1 hypothetical protein ALI144C_52800 [Actinosynnema sp. ALI-1.44]
MSSFSNDFDDIDKLIVATRASIIDKLDAATDFDAVFADIYAQAGRIETPKSLKKSADPLHGQIVDEQRGRVDAVCDHIDLLNAVLEAEVVHDTRSPLFGTIYLSTARRSLRRLRDGLTKHRLSRNDALRLIGNVEHNLREADAALRAEHGLSLDEALHDRIGELRELGNDIAGQIQTLRTTVAQLFDEATDTAKLAPTPRS